MAEYRIHRIKNDHIAEPPIVIEAEADSGAIEQAKQFVDGGDVELWHGPRFVIGLRHSEDLGWGKAGARQQVGRSVQKCAR